MFIMALLPVTAQAQSWYNASWNYRKKVTIQGSRVGSGTHVSFPVLVSTTDVSLQANALSTGNDILFTSSNGTTKLEHEIESYNSLTGELVAWVELPSISSAANTDVYMYYGNGAAVNQQSVSGTWSALFRGVYHLNGSFADATSNNYTGVNTGTTAATGMIAGGRGYTTWNGADFITITGKMGSPSSITLSAWVYVTAYDASGAEIISIGDNVMVRMTSTGVNCSFYNGSSWVTTTSGSVNYSGTWRHIAYTASNGAQRVYVDGALVGSSSTFSSISYFGLGANTFIGKHGNGNTSMDFNGTLDEVRVAGTVRSAAWLLTEFNNQSDPSSFYTIGNCESQAPAVVSPVNYCQGATAVQLSATGTNLAWGTGVSGVAGGTSNLSSATYVDYQWNNQKTNFTTTTANVTLSSVDFFIPAWNNVTGLSLAIFNSTGTIIASSSPITQSAGGSLTKVTVPFNFLITAAGNYSIGIATGDGNVGGDAPSFPLTEATGTINITGKTGSYRCFNNFIFSRSGPSTAPTPSTASAGTTNYLVTQSPGGCVSPAATIAVVVTGTVGTPTAITISSGTQPTCQLVNGTTTTTYATTATNNTGFNWSLSTAAAGSISSAGVMTWANGFSGSVTIRATANGCSGPSAMVTRAVTITPTVGTPTAITVASGTQPTCQLTNGVTTTTYATTSTNSTTRTWSVSNAAAGVINSTSGVMTWANGFSGTVDIRVVGNGCNGPSAQVVRTVSILAAVGTPAFTLGASSSRCQAAGTVSYAATAANATSISYALDATSIAGGNSISATTGDVTFASGWSGSSTITATAAGCNGPVAAVHTVSTNASPLVSGVSSPSCVGGSTGTITASGSGGLAPYTYNLNGGTGQSSTLFTGLAAGSYTLNVVAANGCTGATTVIVPTYGTSPDNQATQGNNTWIGHVYDGTSFSNYVGSYSTTETFNESFGGNTTCFSVTSNSLPSAIYTETFSVKYRMLSSRRGLYVVDLGSDDGSRLTVDGSPVYDSWSDHSFINQPRVLLSLTGSSSLLYEYYENGGGNQVVFQNLTSVLSNTLTANTSQSICLGSSGAPIGGDTIGTLPAGITASGTGYQWTYSTTPAGTRTAIAGATGATFTPSAAIAPFNAAGTYYVYRNVALSSSNNVSPNPYVATNESIAATFVVAAPPAATISYSGSPFCTSSGVTSVTRTGSAGGTYSSTAGLSINLTTGAITPGSSTAGTYTVTYTIAASGGCPVYTTTTSVTITKQPFANGYYPGSPYCSGPGIVSPTATIVEGAIGTTSSTAGLVINALGAVNLGTSTPGTYTVTYTVPASGGCPIYTTGTSITISAHSSAAISYPGSPLCSSGGTASVSHSGTAGGVYSALAGLSINAATGVITPSTSTPGSYKVVYTMVNGACTDTANAHVTITAPAVASISYPASPVCASAAFIDVTHTGATGGVYSAPAGLVINALTGRITPSASTPGTYTVTYSMSGGGCTSNATATVTVTAAPTATISYSGTPYCASAGTAPVVFAGTAGGSYSSTAGLSINAASGAIDIALSTPGAYTVTYSLAASGGCPSFAATAGVQVYAPVSGNALTYTNGTSGTICATPGEGGSAVMTAPAGTVFIHVPFASYGTPTGTCSSFVRGSCHATGSQSVSEGYLLGNNSATVPATNTVFGDPCQGTLKRFYLQAAYAQTICAGTAPGAITGGTPAGGSGVYTYLWEQSTSGPGSGFAAAPGLNNGLNYSPGILNQNTWFRRTVASGGCSSVSPVILIPVSLPGSALISYAGNPHCALDTAAAMIRTGTAGGSFSSTAGLSIDPATGQVNPSLSTPGSYTVTYTMVNGGCTTTATAPLTITIPPTASINYSGTPFCTSAGVGSVSRTGTAGGTYSSTAGLTINAATGAITPGSSAAGTYTVSYTIAASGGCAAMIATTVVTITTQPFANGYYPGSPYCSGPGIVYPTATIVQGAVGTVSSTAGLVVDAIGAVNLGTSAPGTYTVTYTVPASGGCAAYTTGSSITISAHSSATIAYPGSPYCSSGGVAAVTHSGTTGGVYTAPAGLAINAATGTITPGSSTPGTYTVVYTMVNGGCTDTANASVTINAPASAAIAYAAAPFCASVAFGDVTLTGATGGVFSAPAGLSLDPATGRIIPGTSTPGTYTVTYTMTGGGCTSTATASVTVTAVPSATINYPTSPLCSSASSGAVTLTGSTGGVFSAGAGLTINAATGAVTPTTSTVGSYTVTYTIAASGGCASFATTASVIIAAPGTWTGAVSTAWHTAGNWYCGALPTITTDVVIGSGLPRYPVVSSGTRPARNITIQSGASLTVTTTLQIAGSVTNNGTFTASNGTILLSGSAPQVIASGQFATNRVLNLTLSNAAGVTLNGPLGITGILRVTAGSFSTGSNLTLISSATRTALIDGTGAGSVLGNVTMQRYLPVGFGYKYLSSPFQAATVGQLSGVINLGASFPTFYRYNENQNYAGWLNHTDPSGVLSPMHGYAGNFGNLTAAKTISLSGTVNNGTLAPLTLYNNNQPYTQGFNLVGNPYPSPINWTAASGWTKTNIDNAIYYFNSGNTDQYGGTYSSYINGISSDGIAAATIPSMQGFFVHVSNGAFPVTGTLGFSNAVRVNSLVPVFHRTTSGPDVPLLRISAGYEAYPELSDPAVVYFDEAATEGFEHELDALKMINTEQRVPSLYCVSGSDKLSINAIPQPGTTTSIPLAIQTDLDGAVVFTVRDLEHLPAGMHAYLADRESGLIQDLSQKPAYKQTLAKGVHSNRFFLLFSSEDHVRMPGGEDLDAYALGTILNVHMTERKGELAVTNALGQLIHKETLNGIGRHEIALQAAPGIYIVTLVSDGSRKAKKVYVGTR